MRQPTYPEPCPTTSMDSEMSFAERAYYAAKSLPKPLGMHTYGLGRHLLGSALFSVNRGPRKNVDVVLPSFRGATVNYKGEELRQDDARVLLGLIHLVRNRPLDGCIQFVPTAFTKSLGWAPASSNKQKLRDCIERMYGSEVQLAANTIGMKTRLIGSFTWSDSIWSVHLGAHIIDLFQGGVTFLPRAERTKLTDGMQTWLASFLRAQTDHNKFKLSDLLKYSGSKAELKRFGEHIRDTMPKLLAAGCVSNFGFVRGYLVVER